MILDIFNCEYSSDFNLENTQTLIIFSMIIDHMSVYFRKMLIETFTI